MRKDIRARKLMDVVGSMMALIGLGGIAGAAEGEGNLMVAIAVFAIGFAEVLWSYQR